MRETRRKYFQFLSRGGEFWICHPSSPAAHLASLRLNSNLTLLDGEESSKKSPINPPLETGRFKVLTLKWWRRRRSMSSQLSCCHVKIPEGEVHTPRASFRLASSVLLWILTSFPI